MIRKIYKCIVQHLYEKSCNNMSRKDIDKQIKELQNYWWKPMLTISTLTLGIIFSSWVILRESDYGIALNMINQWMSVILGLVALTTSIVSILLGFYSVHSTDKSNKEMSIKLATILEQQNSMGRSLDAMNMDGKQVVKKAGQSTTNKIEFENLKYPNKKGNGNKEMNTNVFFCNSLINDDGKVTLSDIFTELRISSADDDKEFNIVVSTQGCTSNKYRITIAFIYYDIDSPVVKKTFDAMVPPSNDEDIFLRTDSDIKTISGEDIKRGFICVKISARNLDRNGTYGVAIFSKKIDTESNIEDYKLGDMDLINEQQFDVTLV